MVYSLQKAQLLKRAAAWLLDSILVCILAAGVAMALSALLNYDGHYQTMNDSYARYEAQYGISFDISYSEYEAMPEADRNNWDAAYEALRNDEGVLHAYNMVITLTLLMTTLSILLAIILVEFVIPLWLKNGQTVGKKVFGLALVRNDCVKINNLQLLTRALLGKATIETLIPVYVLLMIFWGTTGMLGIGILLLLLIAQFMCVAITKTNSAIHDLMAGTVVVDMGSQRIFQSDEELLEYLRKAAAERAARQKY
jgi:uncharacterized RDD family membrane protein YckC